MTDTEVIRRQPQHTRPFAMLVRLDATEHQCLANLATRWGVPRSVALRRLIRAGVEESIRLHVSPGEDARPGRTGRR